MTAERNKKERLIGQNTTDTDYHENMKNGFTDFFLQNGYQEFPPGPIVARKDDTILFTGATITPFMPMLETRVVNPGFFTIQPCLRTQNLENCYDGKTIPEYMSYFWMCGTLASPVRGDEVTKEALSLLTNKYAIPLERIIVKASARDRDLTEQVCDQIWIETDSQPALYYNWRYGRADLVGRGVTFAIRQEKSGVFRDIGNVVAVEKNGKIVAYEFGFGIETLLSRVFDLTKPVEAAKISQLIPFRPGHQEKLVDFLVATTVLFQQGIEPGKGKERYILKKYIKALGYWQRKLGIDVATVRMWADQFAIIEFDSDSGVGNKIAEYLKEQYEQTTRFEDYARNQIKAFRLRNETNIDKLRCRLMNRARGFRLSDHEATETINYLLS
ncbi:hypothetical protein KKC08_03150 [Patescibacteria group bacterium]|nr:hypothetical protein [Patescibacteria group bacterium]MCG2702064.1 alanine--tRNA ligase-related protein [Candidatus Parcubacteria bacterium]MBU4210439.1 hypothetical protein [Patescibacteria group bacterium]MBU4264597.1 hypothetical protein [Patescibacteria group bacterium]MBU4390657.1 hypothetical protein [Patescibacteria group bacterium]